MDKEKIEIYVDRTKEEWIKNFIARLEPIGKYQFEPFGLDQPTKERDLAGYFRGNYDPETDYFSLLYILFSKGNHYGSSSMYLLEGHIEENADGLLITGYFKEVKNTTNREMKALLPIVIVICLVPIVILAIQGGFGGVIFFGILLGIVVYVVSKVDYITAKDKMIQKLREF
ncbi:MAG: hypothetical protein Q4D45_03330 [Lachnospiraceae bacterium]|nr:hypothetical protein [Lachnospiraceae bacterium]